MSFNLGPWIGGNHVKEDDVEAHLERLRSNRGILVAPLNDDADEEPELKQCETIDAVFKTFKPSAEITVKDEEGSTSEERVGFTSIKSFDIESVVDSVPALRGQKEELALMRDLKNQLKENVKLRRAVDDDDQREKLVASLKQALQLLQGSDQ